MTRHPVLSVALALAGLTPYATSLKGQQPAQPPAPERRMMRHDYGPERVMQFVMNRRARLGLKVNLQSRETDSIGAYIDAVTPNGPAAKAGIKSGDIITRVAGKSVLSGGRPEAGGDKESLPGLRLIELAATLEPNDTVSIELRRGKDRKTVSVVTADEPSISFHGRPDGRAFSFRYFRPDDPDRMDAPLDEADLERHFGGSPAFFYGSPLADLELAPLNSDLGKYFGASEGVLVISVPKDSELGLKGGDVVVSVDGRKPASPSHLLRILRSYENGETFKLDVLRNRKREIVTSRLGEKSAD